MIDGSHVRTDRLGGVHGTPVNHLLLPVPAAGMLCIQVTQTEYHPKAAELRRTLQLMLANDPGAAVDN